MLWKSQKLPLKSPKLQKIALKLAFSIENSKKGYPIDFWKNLIFQRGKVQSTNCTRKMDGTLFDYHKNRSLKLRVNNVPKDFDINSIHHCTVDIEWMFRVYLSTEHTIYRNTYTVISMGNFPMKMATPNCPNTVNQFTKL